MDGLLHNTSMGGNAKWNVTVAGAQSSGAAGGTAGDAGYAADAHPSGRVVCKTGTGSNCVPDTLATIYNTPFIMTSDSQTVGSKGISLGGSSYVSGSSSLSGASYISMAFTNVSPAPAVEVTSLTFDYEIFPNDVETAPNPAEFTFIMTAGGSTIADACTQAVAPSSGSTAKNRTVTSSTICSGTSVTTSDVSSYSLTGRASPSTERRLRIRQSRDERSVYRDHDVQLHNSGQRSDAVFRRLAGGGRRHQYRLGPAVERPFRSPPRCCSLARA